MPLSLYFGNAWGACACGKPPVGTENATESTSNNGIFREVFLVANHPNHSLRPPKHAPTARLGVHSSNKDPITGLPTRSQVRWIGAEEIFRGICKRVRNAISYMRRQK